MILIWQGQSEALGLVRVVQAAIFAGLHRISHLADHSYAVPVLEGPHAPRMEKGHAVAIVQDVIQIRLKTWHGAQISVDERNPARLSRHIEMRQQITYGASFGQVYLQVGVTASIRLASITRQLAIQPCI
jgi:hypothetical protein